MSNPTPSDDTPDGMTMAQCLTITELVEELKARFPIGILLATASEDGFRMSTSGSDATCLGLADLVRDELKDRYRAGHGFLLTMEDPPLDDPAEEDED